MKELFERTAMLIGEDGVEKLQRASVAVFGLGGVGSYAVEALARSGVGRLVLFDGDTVCESNINRQLIATVDTVGRYKADVEKERISKINPDAEVRAEKVFYTADNAENYRFDEFSYIVDAIDMVSAKLEIIQRAAAANVPVISCMGMGNKLDPTAVEVADISRTSVCPLARVMRYELRKRGINHLKTVYSKEPPVKDLERNANGRAVPGSISFVPSSAGLIMAAEVIKDLIK